MSEPSSQDISALLDEQRTFPPSEQFTRTANVRDRAVYEQAAADPEAFWKTQAEQLEWMEPFHTVLEWNPPHAKWFVDGKLNAAVNCVDRHVRNGRRNKAAIVWEGEPGDRRTLTYFDLQREVNLAANVLTAITQITLTRWLLPRSGPGPVIAIWALVSTAALLMVVLVADPHAALVASMPAVAIALIVSRGLAYGMAEPARHSLFTRVPRSIRYKGQNVVDTAVWRFGDLTIALGMNGLRALGVVTAGFAGLSAVAAISAAVIGWRLSKHVQSPLPPVHKPLVDA